MTKVSVRDLRNRGGDILNQVARGEAITVTRDGAEAARLVPIPRRTDSPAELIARRRHLPKIDPGALRRDLDSILDPSL